MSITGGVVLYACSWFLCLFLLLQRGLRTQGEDGVVEPGTPAGAPAELRMGREMLRASGLAMLPVVAFWANAEQGWLTLADLSFLWPASFHEAPLSSR